MTDFVWTGDGVVVGATPSSSNSGSPLMSSVAIAAGDAITFTDFPGFPADKNIGMDLIAAGAGATRCLWAASGTAGRLVFETFYQVQDAFTAVEDIMGIRHSGGNMTIMTVSAAGKVVMNDAAGAGISASASVNALPVGSTIRLACAVTPGTTTSNGRIEWAYWADPSTTSPTESWDSGAARNTGTANTAAVFIGRSTGRAQARQPYYGVIRVKHQASGWFAPYVRPNITPMAELNGDQDSIEPFDIVTLSAANSVDPDGTIASYTFTQVSGPAVTLSGTGSVRTYKAPALSAGATLVFSLTVTDNIGATSAATQVTHTVLTHNEFTGDGIPIRIVSSASYVPSVVVAPVVTRNVFGSGTAPFTLTAYTDGTPGIRLGSFFYTTGTGKDNWKCRGGRVYVPAGSTAIGKPCTIYAYKTTTQVIDYTTATVAAQANIASAVAGWNEVTWTPFSMTIASTGCFVHIAYEFTGAGAGFYSHSPKSGQDAALKSTSGVDLYLNEAQERSEFRIGSGASTTAPDVWYGSDIIVQES